MKSTMDEKYFVIARKLETLPEGNFPELITDFSLLDGPSIETFHATAESIFVNVKTEIPFISNLRGILIVQDADFFKAVQGVGSKIGATNVDFESPAVVYAAVQTWRSEKRFNGVLYIKDSVVENLCRGHKEATATLVHEMAHVHLDNILDQQYREVTFGVSRAIDLWSEYMAERVALKYYDEKQRRCDNTNICETTLLNNMAKLQYCSNGGELVSLMREIFSAIGRAMGVSYTTETKRNELVYRLLIINSNLARMVSELFSIFDTHWGAGSDPIPEAAAIVERHLPKILGR